MAFLKKPKLLHWTAHSKAKMQFYRLTPSRIRRILHTPKRIEQGIAPGTVAYMQRAGNSKHQYELWVMIEDTPRERKVVSAWRYPGTTNPGEPLPAEIINEFRMLI